MGASFGTEFRAAHPEEIGPDGVIKVCIGGGAGFIGSHIAKRLKAEVMLFSKLQSYDSFVKYFPNFRRDVTLFVQIGRIMNSWKSLNFAMNSTN